MITAIKKSVTVKKGGLVAFHTPELKAGDTAEVIVLFEEEPQKKRKKSKKPLSSLDWLAKNAIYDPSLPTDMAHQHDHYLYGLPKKKD